MGKKLVLQIPGKEEPNVDPYEEDDRHVNRLKNSLESWSDSCCGQNLTEGSAKTCYEKYSTCRCK